MYRKNALVYRPGRFVLTGGPGAGKTTLLHALRKRGYACVDEAARSIIREQTVSGGDALPWGDTGRYADLMLGRSLCDFRWSEGVQPPCFYDRGIPDTLAYVRLIGLPESKWLRAAVARCRYDRTVFLCPPWPEIYRTDEERKQSFRTAVETYRMIRSVYIEAGYCCCEVPCVSVEQRADFIEAAVTVR